jgi:hypothetical protein
MSYRLISSFRTLSLKKKTNERRKKLTWCYTENISSNYINQILLMLLLLLMSTLSLIIFHSRCIFNLYNTKKVFFCRAIAHADTIGTFSYRWIRKQKSYSFIIVRSDLSGTKERKRDSLIDNDDGIRNSPSLSQAYIQLNNKRKRKIVIKKRKVIKW